MFCSKCGAELAEGTVFCPKCGTKVLEVQDSEEVKIDENGQSQETTKDKVEGKIKEALTLENVESGTERNGKNIVVQYMTPGMYKIAFIGALIGGIITIPEGVGIILILADIFILKYKFAAWVKGFIVDYDKKTVFIPEASVQFDTGFDFKKFWQTYRKGIEFKFEELKSLDAEYQRTVEESNGNYQVKQYKIVTCVTTFGTVRVKMKATNPRFEQVLAGLEDVIAYNNANK